MEHLRVVIADNESIIRMDLKELLEEAGHEVVAEAANGLQAVKSLLSSTRFCGRAPRQE